MGPGAPVGIDVENCAFWPIDVNDGIAFVFVVGIDCWNIGCVGIDPVGNALVVVADCVSDGILKNGILVGAAVGGGIVPKVLDC